MCAIWIGGSFVNEIRCFERVRNLLTYQKHNSGECAFIVGKSSGFALGFVRDNCCTKITYRIYMGLEKCAQRLRWWLKSLFFSAEYRNSWNYRFTFPQLFEIRLEHDWTFVQKTFKSFVSEIILLYSLERDASKNLISKQIRSSQDRVGYFKISGSCAKEKQVIILSTKQIYLRHNKMQTDFSWKE